MFVSVRVSPLAASYRASIASALIREAASPWARNGAVSCAYRVRLCVVSDAVSRVSMQVSATARGRIHVRIGARISLHSLVSRPHRECPDTRGGLALTP
jgi:hypothetical protein